MDALDTMVLLSLVKPTAGWSLELVIATRVAQLRGGGLCSPAIAQEWTGSSRARCSRAISRLEAKRILRRDPGSTGREHDRWSAISDDWRRWRVEWQVDRQQVAAQLAHAAQQREESPLTRVFARPHTARFVNRIARSYDARSWDEDMAELAQVARHGDARFSEGVATNRAVETARFLGRRRASLERAILGERPQRGPTGVVDDEAAAGAGAGTSSRERDVDPAASALCDELVRRCIPAPNRTRAFLNGPPRYQLLDLIEHHGETAVRSAMEAEPAGEMSPLLMVDAIASRLVTPRDDDGGAALASVTPLPAAEPVELQRLRMDIARFERQEEPVPKHLLEALARWQTEATPQEVHA